MMPANLGQAVLRKISELPLQRLRGKSEVIVVIDLYDPIAVRSCDIDIQ